MLLLNIIKQRPSVLASDQRVPGVKILRCHTLDCLQIIRACPSTCHEIVLHARGRDEGRDEMLHAVNSP